MAKPTFGIFILILGLILPGTLLAQGEVQVVPIGETIKPEAGSTTTRRRRYRPPVVKTDTTFLVELGTALSSGLTQEGETISIRAAENVGKGKYSGILMGASGRGRVTKVDKKEKVIEATFDTIEDYQGDPVPITGKISLRGEGKDDAAAAVGDHFTATLDEKIIVKRSRKKKGEGEPEVLTGFIEISGKGAKADIKKGKAKGKVQMVLEAPKGFTADDIVLSSVALAKVNGGKVANPPKPDARKPKQGDANKNGTTDWKLYFDAWDFIKNQRKGMNTIVVKGNLKNGQTFEATTRVQVDY